MAGHFTFDISKFRKAVAQAPEAIDRGLKNGLTDVKNDWVADSVDIAPIDTGNLRRQINGEVVDGTSVEISVPAVRNGFNYAYYIHEDKGVTRSGEKKFLDVPAQQNEGKWGKWLEEELESELKKAGWR